MDWQVNQKAEIVTLFEYESVNLLDNYELTCLERLNKMTGTEILRPVVKQGQLHLQAKQYVGVVRLGKRTIQILPKFHCSKNREQNQQEASSNLLLMLDYAGYLGIREVKLAGLQRSQNWFEVLIYLFTSHLKNQWHRGAYFNYQPINAVLPILKGKWQIATQLKRPEQKHQFAVTYDEFTADNPLNRIFRYVVEGLCQLTRDGGNRQRLTELRGLMDEVKLLPVVTADMARNIQLTRLNKQYQPLLNLAQLFLERLSLKLSASDITTFSFVFDMNQLFERFIVGFIQRHHSEILPISLDSCEILPQGGQASKYLAYYKGQQVFRLKPDLVFKNNDHFPVVMDIKYKHLDEGDRKLGIAQSDFYQMYAYANRYNCPQVILVYPQTPKLSASKRACFEIEATHQKIWAVTVNLLKNLSEPEARQTLKAELKEILEKVDE